MLDVTLKPGRDRSVRRRHPWLLSGAIASVGRARSASSDDRGSPAPDDAGAWTVVRSARGEVLGHGHYSPQSTIRVRLLDFGALDPGEGLLDRRIGEAVRRRVGHPLLAGTDAVRLINAEGDGLPGLVVDRYADVVVVRASTAGMQRRMAAIADALREATGARAGLERADGHAARREGFEVRDAPLWGDVPDRVAIDERGRRYQVDVLRGQKTGFYLDQRDARDLVERLAVDRRMLDAFCYSGGFAVAAAQGGARTITLLDSSAAALQLAQEHLRATGRACPVEARAGDAFEALRRAAAQGERFDLMVLDPPPLARRKGDVPAASRAYKDMLLHGLACASEGAHVLAFSCSHHVGSEPFGQIVAAAAVDAGRAVQIEQRFGAPADHPVCVQHPEGEYLHGLLLRVCDATPDP